MLGFIGDTVKTFFSLGRVVEEINVEALGKHISEDWPEELLEMGSKNSSMQCFFKLFSNSLISSLFILL